MSHEYDDGTLAAERARPACFYCSGPNGRNEFCPDHGDEATQHDELLRLRARCAGLETLLAAAVKERDELALTHANCVDLLDDSINVETEECARMVEAVPFQNDTLKWLARDIRKRSTAGGIK